MLSGSSWPDEPGRSGPDDDGGDRGPDRLQDDPAAQLAGRGTQGLERGEELALLQDDQGEEQRHDQAGHREAGVDDRVQAGLLLLGARDGQVGLLGAGHDDPRRGRDLLRRHAVGQGQAEHRGLDRLAGELGTHGSAHVGVGVQGRPRRGQALVAGVADDAHDGLGHPAHLEGRAEAQPGVGQGLVDCDTRGILRAGEATLEHRARDARGVRLGHEAHDDEVRPARDAGGGRDQRADRGGLLDPVDGLELGLRRQRQAGADQRALGVGGEGVGLGGAGPDRAGPAEEQPVAERPEDQDEEDDERQGRR